MSATFIRNCIAYKSSTGEDLYATLLETAESNIGNGDHYRWSVHHASTLDDVMVVERHLASVTYDQGIYWQPGRNGSGKHHLRKVDNAIAFAMEIRPDERIPWVGEKTLLWLNEGNSRRKFLESWHPPEGFQISVPVSTMYLDCVVPTLKNIAAGLRFAKAFNELTSQQGSLIAPEKTGIQQFDELLESLKLRPFE
jgi:hypothetical protein